MFVTLDMESDKVYTAPATLFNVFTMPMYRQPHDLELMLPGPSATSPDRNYRLDGSKGWPRYTTGKTIPEPFRLSPGHQVPLDCGWQNLIRVCNPEHKDTIVDIVLDQHWVLANKTGIGAPLRKNCRNGDNMKNPLAKWPALHTPIITGGGLMSGIPSGGNLNIESLLTTNPVPTAEYVLSRPWLWFWLTEVNPEGVVTYMRIAARDGTRQPVRMPLISKLQLYAPLRWLHKMPLDFDPTNYDPRKIF